MKKFLIICMMCLVNTMTFAKDSSSLEKLCRAHYYLLIQEAGKPDLLLYSTAVGETCAGALVQAKLQAADMLAIEEAY